MENKLQYGHYFSNGTRKQYLELLRIEDRNDYNERCEIYADLCYKSGGIIFINVQDNQVNSIFEGLYTTDSVFRINQSLKLTYHKFEEFKEKCINTFNKE